MTDEEFATIEAMRLWGGSFVKQLAVLFTLGDPVNQRRLRHAFSDYFDRYETIARDRAKEGRS